METCPNHESAKKAPLAAFFQGLKNLCLLTVAAIPTVHVNCFFMLSSLLPLPLRRLAWLAALGCASASAQNSLPELNALGSQWVQSAIGQGSAGGDEALQSLPLRMEVHVGKLDARLQLAPCNQVEPYLPVGSKLWGRTRIGLRCIEPGARPWNVFLPVTVQAWGMGWVLNTNVNAGETLDASSASQAEVDWAADTSPVIALPEGWVGQTAARNLMARQTLRQSMVRPAEVFAKGATVKVLAKGAGFVVTSSGKAVNGAGIGETVKVRMDNGRLVSGTVNAQGDVETGM